MYRMPDRSTVLILRAAFALWRFWWALIIALVALGLWGVQRSEASCGSIPDRQGALCTKLGCDSGCSFEWADRLVLGKVTLIADDVVGEPGAEIDEWATTLRFQAPNFTVSDTYTSEDDAPCIVPRCVEKKIELGEIEYSGLGPLELVNVANVLNKMLYNPPADAIAEAFRQRYGVQGVPVVVWAWAIELRDRRGTGLATELDVGVVVLFATGCS